MYVAGNMPAESINNVVTKNVEVDANLSVEEIEKRTELVEQFKEVIDVAGGDSDKLSNITQAIESSPDEWGQILSNANVTPDTLSNMATAIENGESISGDLVNLSYGAITGAVSSLADKYSNKEETAESTIEGQEMSADEKETNESSATFDEAKANKFAAQATSILDVPSDEVTSLER